MDTVFNFSKFIVLLFSMLCGGGPGLGSLRKVHNSIYTIISLHTYICFVSVFQIMCPRSLAILTPKKLDDL